MTIVNELIQLREDILSSSKKVMDIIKKTKRNRNMFKKESHNEDKDSDIKLPPKVEEKPLIQLYKPEPQEVITRPNEITTPAFGKRKRINSKIL